MKKTHSAAKPPTADTIARMADSGKNISRFFTNSGKMMKPVQRVNVDFSAPMVEELDREAKDLNISHQAVIKTLVRQAPGLGIVRRRCGYQSSGAFRQCTHRAPSKSPLTL
jgi:hypothetical protein